MAVLYAKRPKVSSLRTTSITNRLAGTGGEKWALHGRACRLAAEGRDVIALTIGEPDIPTPDDVVEPAVASLRARRTLYSSGRGEPVLLDALADHYSARESRPFGTDQFLCLPGTQSALFAVMLGVAESGCEVLVPDPMYATYEGVVRACGADPVSVPLRAERQFRLDAADLASGITERTTALLLNNPHNPTGAVLTEADVAAVCDVAAEHDLWIVADEVYADFADADRFVSPLRFATVADRVVAVSSISKSHAAPGLRSGWAVGPAEFITRLLPVVESMLFGNQPFIADATAEVIRNGSTVVAGMAERFGRRAALLEERLHASTDLRVLRPAAGMFAMVDVSATGMTGLDYAHDLLDQAGVAVMPGSSFGTTVESWVRVALTVDDDRFAEAIDRIIAHSEG